MGLEHVNEAKLNDFALKSSADIVILSRLYLFMRYSKIRQSYSNNMNRI